MAGDSILRYNSARLFGQSKLTQETVTPISLVTDFEFGFNISRENIKSVGYNEILKPVVSNQRPYFRFSYFISDLNNEKLFRMPVDSEEVFGDNKPMFTGLETMDFFFLSSESGEDFAHLNQGELSACVFTDAFLTSYSMEILKSGMIKVDVSWEASNVKYKKFKDLSGYKYIEAAEEDLKITNRTDFELNNGEEEINLDIGGFGAQGGLQSFSFSADIPTKTLYDFGQYSHKKDIKFPVEATISTRAFVRKQLEGRLDNILCSDNGVDFLFSNYRESCDNKNLKDNKSAFIFKKAQIASQKYSLETSRGSYFIADLQFTISITKDSGVYISSTSPDQQGVFEDLSSSQILDLLKELRDGM